MRKFTLLLLAMMAGMGTASAYNDLYLRTDFDGQDHWNDDVDAMKFTYVETNGSNEDVYTYIINASDIKKDDIWFRLHLSGWGALICPYTSNGSYTFQFENGQNETYGAKYEKTYFQGSDYSFGISHSTIKASQYKITVFRGNNETYYENENCRVMWIKIDIVSKPATVSSLGYATFSCDRALDFTGVTGLTAYKASVNNEAKVVLTKVDGKVAAGTGLLLAGNSADIPVVETSAATALEGNLLVASLTDTEVAASTAGTYHYFLAGSDAESLGFYNLAVAATSSAGKAYLETSTELAAETVSARVSWIFQDDATAINAVENAENADVVYDLQGRVAKTAKAGLYIKNGKKFIVK